jgi:hypothetical protein
MLGLVQQRRTLKENFSLISQCLKSGQSEESQTVKYDTVPDERITHRNVQNQASTIEMSAK